MTAFSAAKRAAAKAANIAARANQSLPSSRANELRLSAAGGVIGAVGGAVFVGGIGLAALGGAIPLSGAAVVGGLCVFAGNKIGSEIDRRKERSRLATEDPESL